jgi:aminoglycoside phosphotransferase (APT) family kinase protein
LDGARAGDEHAAMADEIVERIEVFLSTRWGGEGAPGVRDYTPITGGYSRAMSRFRTKDGRGFVMRADPPPGQSILDTDRTREWTLLCALWESGQVPIPQPLWFDETGEELGSPAFISAQLEGDSLHVLANKGDEESNRAYVPDIAALAANLRHFDVSKLPDHIERPASWDAYIDGFIQTWRDAEAANAEHEPFLRSIAAWLEAHKPPPAPLTLVHGDFQGTNIFVESDTGTYHLLDWELARVGDPREDLGWWALAMGSQPPDLIAQNQDAFYTKYRELTGLSEDIVNPATVAYFTVLSSGPVFFNILKMTTRLAQGENMGMNVAYMTNAMPYMHSAWMAGMKTAGHWTKD